MSLHRCIIKGNSFHSNRAKTVIYLFLFFFPPFDGSTAIFHHVILYGMCRKHENNAFLYAFAFIFYLSLRPWIRLTVKKESDDVMIYSYGKITLSSCISVSTR